MRTMISRGLSRLWRIWIGGDDAGSRLDELLESAVRQVENEHGGWRYPYWSSRVGDNRIMPFIGSDELEIDVQVMWDDHRANGGTVRVVVSVLHTSTLDIFPATSSMLVTPPEHV